MASIDPSTLATNLATAYTQSARALLTAQTKSAQATSTALSKLQSALKAFDSAMDGLSNKKGLQQRSAAFSDTALGTAEANAAAIPGSYPIFVERVATSHQVAFENLPPEDISAWPAGPLNMTVKLANGGNFVVNLANADSDGNKTLSQVELARAINQASGNGGKVSAQIVTVGGQSQLMLGSGVSGEGGKVSLDVTGLPAGALRDKLGAAPKELVAAQDAVVWLGEQNTGTRIQQGSNQLTAIPGVTVTLKKAQANGSAAAVLSVAKDDGATSANIKTFIDAYNTLEKTLDELTAVGKDGTAPAAFASDAGVRSLRNRLGGILRQEFGGLTLRDLGINADRSGQLSLDSKKLEKTLAAKPDALDTVFGSTATAAPSGLMGAFAAQLDKWTSSTKGQIQQRQTSVQTQQKALNARQTRLDTQYDTMYQRYLKQFTALQQVQSRMSETGNLFNALGT
ncbi:flagellar filament capping protein FliD [Roseateles sp. DAIF2]|uniref:flagellar filament capping protein FliD n=1 Tax=Roseateles sp. DAIF2 TaxID=2714952 RepID=UPI0018A3000B|nr:flagellar filament capping protein FliD [Roseateles sp. DAIF2]QPF74166.1 flagellar filament capping protein FliD [Roseateles sp. DAIF2]